MQKHNQTHRTVLHSLLSTKSISAIGILSSFLWLSSAQAETYHIVEKGETLTELSQRFNISVAKIVKANESKKQQLIPTGTKIILPIGNAKKQTTKAKKPSIKKNIATTYRVQPDDTLTGIAQKFNVSLTSLATINDMGKYDTIYYGKELIIPLK